MRHFVTYFFSFVSKRASVCVRVFAAFSASLVSVCYSLHSLLSPLSSFMPIHVCVHMCVSVCYIVFVTQHIVPLRTPTPPSPYQSVKNIFRCQRLQGMAWGGGGDPLLVVVVIFMATFITFILYFYELNCLLLLYYYVSLWLFMRVFLVKKEKRDKKGKLGHNCGRKPNCQAG